MSRMHYYKHCLENPVTQLVMVPDAKWTTEHIQRMVNMILKFNIFLYTRTKIMGKLL